MPLSPGVRLGPYQVLGRIGAGGMGEVYKATDTRLNRTVAIKVLSPELTDAEHRARLESEARLIASLSHAHICTLYDVGRDGESLFLVMEHLPGETLAQRLQRGPLPFSQVLEIGRQIAEALAAAHRANVVHRDLKPANVMLTRSGVKLLDFGLARLRAPAVDFALAATTTQQNPLTGRGTIVGTLPYMAPEQIEGKDTDARTDIWALGLVLYEMAAGRRAFDGESSASIIAGILGREPVSLRASVPAAPPLFERLVRECLDKDPDRRLQSAHDVALQLAWLAAPESSAAGPARRSRWTWMSLAAALVAVSSIIAVRFLTAPPAAPAAHPVVRMDVEVPGGRHLGTIALSRDGNRIVYVGRRPGHSQLFSRALGESSDRALPGTDDGTAPFFAPDGQSIAFFAAGALKRISLSGGDAVSIYEPSADQRRGAAVLPPSGTWTDDDSIVFSGGATGLYRVPAAGGVPTPVTRLETVRGELGHRWPTVLPGGKHLLFTVARGVGGTELDLVVQSLETGARRQLVADTTNAAYVHPGYVVYGAGHRLVAARLDFLRGELQGEPVTIAEDVAGVGDTKEALFAVSAAGDLAYGAAVPLAPVTLVRVDRHGKTEAAAHLPSQVMGALSLSPDDQRLAIGRFDSRVTSVWSLDVRRGIITPFITEGHAHAAVWSPDGRQIAFSSDQAGASNTFIRQADGSTAKRLVTSPRHGDPGAWSPDGRWLVYAEVDPITGWDLYRVNLATHETAVFRSAAGTQRNPAISPDGRWIAYSSDEAGQPEVFTERFPDAGERMQISDGGGTEPLWSSDGGELFFRTGTRLMSVRIHRAAVLTADRPAPLFETPYFPASTYGPTGYAVTRDGHFYFLQRDDVPAPPSQIHLVLGWFDEFRKRIASR